MAGETTATLSCLSYNSSPPPLSLWYVESGWSRSGTGSLDGCGSGLKSQGPQLSLCLSFGFSSTEGICGFPVANVLAMPQAPPLPGSISPSTEALEKSLPEELSTPQLGNETNTILIPLSSSLPIPSGLLFLSYSPSPKEPPPFRFRL